MQKGPVEGDLHFIRLESLPLLCKIGKILDTRVYRYYTELEKDGTQKNGSDEKHTKDCAVQLAYVKDSLKYKEYNCGSHDKRPSSDWLQP